MRWWTACITLMQLGHTKTEQWLNSESCCFAYLWVEHGEKPVHVHFFTDELRITKRENAYWFFPYSALISQKWCNPVVVCPGKTEQAQGRVRQSIMSLRENCDKLQGFENFSADPSAILSPWPSGQCWEIQSNKILESRRDEFSF